jgi:hypothetical protein
VVLGKVVTALAIGASAAFYTGMWFAPKWDEQTDRVVKRLSGDIEVLVKRKHTGEAVADAHIELLPVTKSVRAITDAQGKARIVWDMLQPDADSLRLELVVAPREVPTSGPAPPTRQSLGNTSTVKAVVVNVP